MVRGFCLVDYKYYIGNNFCINVRLLLLEVTRTDLEEGKRNRDKCVFVLDQKPETVQRTGQDSWTTSSEYLSTESSGSTCTLIVFVLLRDVRSFD